MNENIFSQCRYDVDNRYVDLSIRVGYFGDAFELILTDSYFGDTFELILTDTSDIENTSSEIGLCLTREDLKLIIDRLTEVLEK